MQSLPHSVVISEAVVLIVCRDDGVRARLVSSVPPGVAVRWAASEGEAIDILHGRRGSGAGGEADPPPGVRLVPDGVMVADTHVRLTCLEHAMLRCLLDPAGSVWSHLALSEQVWGTSFVGDGSQVRAVLKRLRRKLAAAATGLHIESVRGRGLRLVVGSRPVLLDPQLPHNCPSVPVADHV